MICASCHTVNLEGMVSCVKCGRALTGSRAEEPGSLPRVTWQIREGTPQTFLLSKAVTTIGRVGVNDIILPEVGVSRQHARIERSDTRTILVDLGSLNGTFLNRRRIETAPLEDGDELQVGKYRLVFLAR